MYALIFFSALLLMGNWWVVYSTDQNIFSDYQQLPNNPVGLVLGTSSRLSNGQPNLFFDNRMQVAADLFRLRKISHIIVSGDNRTKFYNEPMEMKRLCNDGDVVLTKNFLAPDNGIKCSETRIIQCNDRIRHT